MENSDIFVACDFEIIYFLRDNNGIIILFERNFLMISSTLDNFN